jgi:hypothetical protein
MDIMWAVLPALLSACLIVCIWCCVGYTAMQCACSLFRCCCGCGCSRDRRVPERPTKKRKVGNSTSVNVVEKKSEMEKVTEEEEEEEEEEEGGRLGCGNKCVTREIRRNVLPSPRTLLLVMITAAISVQLTAMMMTDRPLFPLAPASAGTNVRTEEKCDADRLQWELEQRHCLCPDVVVQEEEQPRLLHGQPHKTHPRATACQRKSN